MTKGKETRNEHDMLQENEQIKRNGDKSEVVRNETGQVNQLTEKKFNLVQQRQMPPLGIEVLKKKKDAPSFITMEEPDTKAQPSTVL